MAADYSILLFLWSSPIFVTTYLLSDPIMLSMKTISCKNTPEHVKGNVTNYMNTTLL